VPGQVEVFNPFFVRAAQAAAAFHPSSQPLLARRSYALELGATLFFAITLIVIDGGVVAVFTKQTFADIVPEGRLNMLVAILGSTAEVANLLSFVWGSVGQGRRKVPLINILQLATILATGVIAALPRTPIGLYLLVLTVITARVCWSGIVTLRPTLWRANYPARLRAQIVGRFSVVQMFVVAVGGMALGWLLDKNSGAYRVAVPIACVLGLGAVVLFSKVRVRGERALLTKERSAHLMKLWSGPAVMWKVLRQDRHYAQFMICMFILGFGNMMVTPVLVFTLRDQFDLTYFRSILITSSITALVMPIAIPAWARLLDRAHVVRFRAIQGWAFVVASSCFLLGAWLHQLPFMFCGAVAQGVALGGGNLAWNLGHVDFAPPSETSHYMATHVTLNGIRGLTAPLFSVAIYEAARHAGLNAPVTMFIATLAVTTAGCVGFVWLLRTMGQAARQVRRVSFETPRRATSTAGK
jgi:MFS family permease